MPHLPMGSKEQLDEAGLSVEENGSCHPRMQDALGRHVRGCAFWEQCRFAQPKHGGFRGEGPKMVGYYYRLSKADGGAAKMASIPCFDWHASGLDDKFKAQAETGEKLMIVAQEGEFIQIRDRIPVDPNNNKTGDGRMKDVIHKEQDGKCACGDKKCVMYVVPKFPSIEDQTPALVFETDLEKIVTAKEREHLLAEVESGEG